MPERNLRKQKNTGARNLRTWRPWVFSAIVVVVLGAAVWALKPTLWPSSPPTAEGANAVYIQADMAGFSTKTLQAEVGEPMTIQLESLDKKFHTDGGGKHQFAIDELGVDIVAPSLGTAEATFTPSEPGVYEYYCDICCGGRANPTMQGELIVE